MNYLAHLYFAENTADSMLGNLMPDFVKGLNNKQYNDVITKGIMQHRLIDKYTDAHQTVKLSKSRISTCRSRFSGIMIDVFYDHFLALHWSQFSDQLLTDFVHNAMLKLTTQTQEPLPDYFQIAVNRMKAENWLLSYQETKGIEKTIDRISQRIKFKNKLSGGGTELSQNYADLEQDFFDFFPQLQDYIYML